MAHRRAGDTLGTHEWLGLDYAQWPISHFHSDPLDVANQWKGDVRAEREPQ